MQRTPPPMYKKQKKTQKGNKNKWKEQRGAWFRTHELRLNKSKHQKETKKREKNKEVPGFELTNFDCMVCWFNPYATVAWISQK